MQSTADLSRRLAQRIRAEPSEFAKTMDVRESLHSVTAYNPSATVDTLFPGTFFLTHKDEQSRRFYQPTPSL